MTHATPVQKLALLALAAPPAAALAQGVNPAGNAVIRQTTNAPISAFNADALPDLLSLSIVPWQATDPVNDLYTGQQVAPSQAHLFRLDMVLNGLFNPPGPIFNPFFPDGFGPRPVFALIEIDLDNNIDSGGEVESVSRSRFLGNVGRFGALPPGTAGARVATSAAAYDGFFDLGPQFERSGADMTVVLCGCSTPTSLIEIGNQNGILDAGETMIMRGRFLERFGALTPYSGVFGGGIFGAYDPPIDVRFSHDIATDHTTVTIVYALDPTGAAAMTGQPVEPVDFSLSNHTSVQEMLFTTIKDSSGCCGPIFSDPEATTLSQPWQDANFNDSAAVLARTTQFLDPTQWRATALVGTAYTTPEPEFYVWTDIGFNTRFGDLNHDGALTSADSAALQSRLDTLDGTISDADSTINGVVVIPNFGANFDVADLNSDGVIDANDLAALALARTDLNGDGHIDGVDLAIILSNFGPCAGCPADLSDDGVVDGADLARILSNWAT